MFFVFFFFQQKTAYEMRISDWSSDVCSSDLGVSASSPNLANHGSICSAGPSTILGRFSPGGISTMPMRRPSSSRAPISQHPGALSPSRLRSACRSEEHTSELQSLMRISYAVFCLQKKKKQ